MFVDCLGCLSVHYLTLATFTWDSLISKDPGHPAGIIAIPVVLQGFIDNPEELHGNSLINQTELHGVHKSPCIILWIYTDLFGKRGKVWNYMESFDMLRRHSPGGSG